MSQAQAVSPLVLTLVAGGFATFGVVLKIGYDSLAARRTAKSAGMERFADERRQVYEKFYELVQRQLARDKALYALVEAHHKEGKAVISDEEKARFPPAVLGELITLLDEMRRLARIYSVVTAAEAIVRLFVDMTRAAGAALDNPGPTTRSHGFCSSDSWRIASASSSTATERTWVSALLKARPRRGQWSHVSGR
jgi:hypothetical protein